MLWGLLTQYYVKDLERDKLHVTARTQEDNAEFSSEILTQFLLELDSKYTSGEETPPDEKYAYNEKYIYGISPEDINIDEVDAIYIVRNDELIYFDQSQYRIVEFEEYRIVIHRLKGNGA